MKSIKILICLISLMTLFPINLSASVANYEQLLQRETEAYKLHNTETVSFDGQIWTRQYGMKEYYVSPSVKDIRSYMLNVRGDKGGTGGFELIKVNLNSKTKELLSEYQVNVAAEYPKADINVMLPGVYVAELRGRGLSFQVLDFDRSNVNSSPASREDRYVIYEQGFEEPLDPQEYEISGFIEQPDYLYKNVCWGIVDCESYEEDQSLWCCGDIYGTGGWYDEPLDPCTSYTNWVWTYFARLMTIDVTVADELVFEYYTDYALDTQGWSDWLRVWVIDNNVTEWTMVGEYTGGFDWDAVDMEIEDFSNFAYYFEFESDDHDINPGIYLDKISIYNMVPNLTWGEGSMAEYPYQYAPTEPHKLRVFYEIVNDSNADVEETFTTEIVLSVDDDYTTTADNYILETISTFGLNSEEMVSGELVVNLEVVNIPNMGNLPAGTYHVMFMIDNEEDVNEALEDDNLWAPAGTFYFGVANLTPGAGSSFTYPAGTNTTTLEVVAEVLNDGTEAVTSSFYVGIMLSEDNDFTTVDDNYELSYLPFTNAIAAGASATQTMLLDLATTEVPIGDFWIFYAIDVYATVHESNEVDNIWLSNAQFSYLGAPYLEIEPLALNFIYLAGSQTLDVSSNADWVVSENADWISLDTAGGTGDGMVTVTVLDNNMPTPRNANLSFSGAGELIFVTVSQDAGITIIYGDIDATSIVDAYDASLVLQYVVGLPTGIDPFPVINADVDGNGEITAFDAGLIMQFVVNLIDHFPVEDLSRK